jgi:hypothetical protein
MTSEGDYHRWVETGQRVRACYASGPGTHAVGKVIAYQQAPTVVIEDDRGNRVSWAARLCEEAVGDARAPLEFSDVVVPGWMVGEPKDEHDAGLLRAAGFLPKPGWPPPPATDPSGAEPPLRVVPRCTLAHDGTTEVHVYVGEPAAGDTCTCGALTVGPEGWVGIPVGPPVLSCDRCGVTSEDWRRDRLAPVTYFVRDGLCCPCSRKPTRP